MASSGKTSKRARGFDAGQTGRRLRSIPTTTTAINTMLRTYGRNIVARSRYLAANNPYAMAAKDEFVDALVGNGIKPSPIFPVAPVKAALAAAWLQWTDEADADSVTDFYGLQGLVAAEMFEAGECFVRFRPRLAIDGLSVPLQLQLLPSEMLDTGHCEVLSNNRGKIECGVEFNPVGKRVAYHFWRSHPGEQMSYSAGVPGEKVRVPAEEVLHLFRPIRVGQIRGLPHTLAGLVRLALIDLYDDAELERKRVAALFGAFVTRPRAEGEEEHPFGNAAGDAPDHYSPEGGTPSNVSDFTLEPGAVVDLEEGQDVKFSEPADVGNTYEAFQYRNLLAAASGFGATYSGMTGDLRQTSYGSIRAGLVAFRRRIERIQNHVMIFQFCRPVWNRWLREAMRVAAITGASVADYVKNPGAYQRIKWIPPKWDWIDPLKDRQAEKLAVDSGFKSRSDVIEAEGYDPEETDARILADQERAGALGLKFIQLPSGAIVAPDDGDSLVDSTTTINNSLDDYDFG